MTRNNYNLVINKAPSTLKKEWDQIVSIRHNQIVSGEDISFNFVLMPTVMKLLNGQRVKRIIDIGCGSGDLTEKLLSHSQEVIGVDFSNESTSLASLLHKKSGLSFCSSSIEEYAKINDKQFDIAVANMSLMTVCSLKDVAFAISQILHKSGFLIATIPHPAFWPKYWGYENEDWFKYKSEIAIEAPFRISKMTMNYKTTHFHRPLDMYIQIFQEAGFLLETLLEPWPDDDVMKMYPEAWEYPRFLGLKWTLAR